MRLAPRFALRLKKKIGLVDLELFLLGAPDKGALTRKNPRVQLPASWQDRRTADDPPREHVERRLGDIRGRRLEILVRPPQLTIRAPAPPAARARRQAPALAGVALSLSHPLPQRLGRRAELRRHRLHRRPLRRLPRALLHDLPNGALPHLWRRPARTSHRPHPPHPPKQ